MGVRSACDNWSGNRSMIVLLFPSLNPNCLLSPQDLPVGSSTHTNLICARFKVRNTEAHADYCFSAHSAALEPHVEQRVVTAQCHHVLP